MNKIFINKRWALTSILLMLALNMILNAQTSFITEVDVLVNELTSSQNDKYQKILDQETVVYAKFIDLSNLSEAQENGWLTLSMPDKDCIAQVKAKYVSSDESGDFYWYGEVINKGGETEEDCECYEGFVNILRHQGEIIGTISLDEGKYEIQSIGEGKTVLVKKDFSELNLGCGNDDSEGLTEGVEQTVTPRSNGNCPVRVLALFTPNGNNAVANIQNTINLSIAETNQALRNSQVSECDLELILVDVQEIMFVEGNNARVDRDALIDNDDVKALRNNVDADIVVVYTDGNYGMVIGIAGTLTLQPERALCVIEANEATTEFNTAHEIAHLFACRHEPVADPTGPFEHAHEFRTGCWPSRKDRNTVMYSIVTGRTIQHYSNPNVKFKDKATGVSKARENWRQLRANACTVANFRDDHVVPILNANISGEGFGCPCYSGIGLAAQVSGGAPGPYQFEWRTSTDGFNWGPVQSTSSSFSISLPCEIGEGVYLRLSVTSSDGQVDDTFRFIEAAESWPGQQGICPRSSYGNDDHSNNFILTSTTLFPNPVNDVLTLRISNGEAFPDEIVVVDIWGRVTTVRPEIDMGQQIIQIPTVSLPDGMYFLRYGQINALKFLKSSN